MTDFLFAVGTSWDHGLDAKLAQEGAKLVAVITFIGQQLLDAGQQADTGLGLRAIGSVAGRQDKNPRAAELINHRMNLAVSAAFGQANRLNLGPPFPPPAQR